MRLASAGPFFFARFSLLLALPMPQHAALLIGLSVLVCAGGAGCSREPARPPSSAGASSATAEAEPAPQPVPRASDGKAPGSPTEASSTTAPSMTPPGQASGSDARDGTPTTLIETAPGVRIDLGRRLVQLDATVCIEAGWLEQVACTPGTREHESLVAIVAQPRDVHAALLLIGLEPGAPGSWRVEAERLIEIPPRGAPVSIRVRFLGADGAPRVEPIERWIRDAARDRELAPTTWLFAGSLLVQLKGPPKAAHAGTAERADDPDASDGAHAPERSGQPEARAGGTRYLADTSGSVIGLVTFGDEVVAFPTVISDAESVHAPELEAYTERLPPMGTPVLIEIAAAANRPPHEDPDEAPHRDPTDVTTPR